MRWQHLEREIATGTVFEKRDGFGYDLDEEGDEGPDEDQILLTLNLSPLKKI